jgi:hypothetical protein
MDKHREEDPQIGEHVTGSHGLTEVEIRIVEG